MDNDPIVELFRQSQSETAIPNDLYRSYGVKKGLRNEDGTGVLVGLTRIADVVGYHRLEDGSKRNVPGELWYRGYPIERLYERVTAEGQLGFEDVSFLLLFGHLPSEDERQVYQQKLRREATLSETFFAGAILRANTMHTMNKIQSSLLQLYADSQAPDATDAHTFLNEGLSVLAKMPAIIVYAYRAKAHFVDGQSLVIHPVRPELPMAEAILYLLHGEGGYTPEQVRILDLLLILHADHGVGNNSTFASLVVSSTDTDIYSAFSAAVGSLKGPRHGGANITCRAMMNEVIRTYGMTPTDEMLQTYITRLLNKDAFDHSGLVYGIGHAVYTLSDPRCELLKQYADAMAAACGRLPEMQLYRRFEAIAIEMLERHKGRNVSANVDYYSGFIYDMLGIPEDLYTPMFVASRTVGWLAHMIEEKLNSGRIIRPAGKYVGEKYDA